jgi:hypothetical protein
MGMRVDDLVHLFASGDAAGNWLATNPEGQLSSVEEDFQLLERWSSDLAGANPGRSRP